MTDPRALVPPLSEWPEEANRCYVYTQWWPGDPALKCRAYCNRAERAEYEAERAERVREDVVWLREMTTYVDEWTAADYDRLRRITDMLEEEQA